MKKFTGLFVLIVAMALGMVGCSGSSSSSNWGGAGSVATALVGNAGITVHVRPSGQAWRSATDSERTELFGIAEPKTSPGGFFSFNPGKAAEYKEAGTLIRITVGDGDAENGHLNMATDGEDRPFTGRLQAIMLEPDHFSVNFATSLLTVLADKHGGGAGVTDYDTLNRIARGVHETVGAAAKGMGEAGASLTFKDMFHGEPAVTEQTLLAALATLVGSGIIAETDNLKDIEEAIDLQGIGSGALAATLLKAVIDTYTEYNFGELEPTVNAAVVAAFGVEGGGVSGVKQAFLDVYSANFEAMTGRELASSVAERMRADVQRRSTALRIVFLPVHHLYHLPEGVSFDYNDKFGDYKYPGFDPTNGARVKGTPIPTPSEPVPYVAGYDFDFYFLVAGATTANNDRLYEIYKEEVEKVCGEGFFADPPEGKTCANFADVPPTFEMLDGLGLQKISLPDDGAKIIADMDPAIRPFFSEIQSITGGKTNPIESGGHYTEGEVYNLLIKIRIPEESVSGIRRFLSVPIRVQSIDGRTTYETTLDFENRPPS